MTDIDVVLDDPVQKEEVAAHFQAPAIQHNPDGWGPCELPDQFKDIPYQPFSKGDRLGKVSVARLIPTLFSFHKSRLPIGLLFSVDLRLDYACFPGQKVPKYVFRFADRSRALNLKDWKTLIPRTRLGASLAFLRHICLYRR